MIGGRDEDVVDVEQQAAAGSAHDRANEVRFAHRRFAKRDIGGGIFEQDRPADRLLHFVDVIADASESGPRVGQRQQVVEKCGLVGRPGQMLGDQRWLVALNERTKAFADAFVERLRAADRHAHAVQRNRMVAADAFQRMMRRTAGAHIVFGMNLEETVLPSAVEDRRQMFMLEARSRKPRDRMGRKAKTPLYAWTPQTWSSQSLRLLLPADLGYVDRSRVTKA